MKVEEAAVYAMARTSEITSHYPSGRALMYWRLSRRQRQLMALAGRTNPDYYGTYATSNLDGNQAVDLRDIAAPVPTPELIEEVTIADKGASAYANGDRITIVPFHQRDAELPPRATLRDLILQGVDTDLVGVTTIAIYYSRLAAELAPTDAQTNLDIEDPWNELLVLDLQRFLLEKADRLDANIRTAAFTQIAEEEKALLDSYLSHVAAYVATTTRFTRQANR